MGDTAVALVTILQGLSVAMQLGNGRYCSSFSDYLAGTICGHAARECCLEIPLLARCPVLLQLSQDVPRWVTDYIAWNF